MKSLHRTSVRTAPCARPFVHIFVDYNGCLVPCCHIRSDAPEHVDYVLGDLHSHSLKEIFFSTRAIEWRLKMLSPRAALPAPCTYCIDSVLPDFPANTKAIDRCLSISVNKYNIAKKLEYSNKILKDNIAELALKLKKSEKEVVNLVQEKEDIKNLYYKLNDEIEKNKVLQVEFEILDTKVQLLKLENENLVTSQKNLKKINAEWQEKYRNLVVKSAFPQKAQRIFIAAYAPFVKLFAAPEFYTKFKEDSSDFFAASKNPLNKVYGKFLSLFGPEPVKTEYRTRKG